MTGFADFARTHGVEIVDLFASDRIRRCPTVAHPRSKNGAYWYDGSRGWVQNWERSEKPQWWDDPTASPWTEAERAEWIARRRLAEAERRQTQQRAADRAAQMIGQAAVTDHGYLRAKGFGDLKGLTVDDDRELLIPMRDLATNSLVGVQTVRLVENAWQKRFIAGQRTKEAVFVLGRRNAPETWLVEGYCTGLSVERALRQLRIQASVMVTFSAQNLLHCSERTRGRRYVFADNDKSRTGEKIACATGLPWVMSEAVGEDANDLHQRAGLLAVCKSIMHTRRQQDRAQDRRNNPNKG